MARSKWKLTRTFIEPLTVKHWSQIIAAFPFKKKPFNDDLLVIARSAIITKECVGKVAYIYTGRNFITRTINERMVGYKFGAFALTRVRHVFKKKEKKAGGRKH